MTDETKPFKLDVVRILRIKDQVDRGEKISAEDVAYVRECVLAIAAAVRPAIEAIVRALEDFGRRMQQISARRTPANGGTISRPATKVAPFINVSGTDLISFSGTDPTALDPAIRDRVINKERRNYR